MRLKNIEATGFKSFAKKTALSFESPITAIVGPNGSGKSNVAEAFRWVLGEQSLKSLRGKRGEDLIFNGGPSGARASRASVTLTFDNRNKTIDIDYDEVAITRTVFRDGTNEYKINNSQVRLKDIIELLAKVSLGASGHHIISQGEADRILNANPKDRKNMIEDALGLKIYHWKLAESTKKLSRTEENIKQVESLRREIAPHIKFLKKQVDKVERADEMRRELGGLYREYLKRESLYIDLNKKKIEKEKREPEEELAKLEKEIASFSQIENKEDETLNNEYQKAEAKIREHSLERDELGRTLGRLEGMAEIKKESLSSENNEHRDVPFNVVKRATDDLLGLITRADSTNILEDIKQVLSEAKNIISSLVTSSGSSKNSEKQKEELSKLEDKLRDTQDALRKIEFQIDEQRRGASEIKTKIDREAERARGAEKETLILKMKKRELESEVSRLGGEEDKLEKLDRDFSEEILEGKTLVNQEIQKYKDFPVTKEDVLGESREKQEARRKAIERIKIRLEDMGVEGGDVMEEYKQTTERDTYLEKELEDLVVSKKSLGEVMRDLEDKLQVEFKTGLVKINEEFNKFFNLMFGGGKASLSLIRAEKRKKKKDELDEDFVPDELEDENEDGIEISVSLPRKNVKSLNMLSGGERALTSIALLFSMSQVNPPPFLILDETDAALDEANSRKYGDMVENLSKHSQLILITHNRETMGRAGILYGVTMSRDGISQLLSVKFDEASKYAK